MSRRLFVTPLTRASRPRFPVLRAEGLEDRTAPAVFNLAIDPVINNAAAVAELISVVQQSNANGEQDTINLFPGGPYTFDAPYKDPATNTATLNALPDIVPNRVGTGTANQDGITINGQGATLARSTKAAADFRLVSMTFAKTLGTPRPSVIRDLTITGGKVTDANGGGIVVTGSGSVLEFENVIFSNNTAAATGKNAASGGAASFSSAGSGSINFRECQFLDNKAVTDGGAVNFSGASTITDTTFARNQTTAGAGGALYNASGQLAIRSSLFVDNMATGGAAFAGGGGAILVGGAAQDQFINVTFHRNYATGFGGAISLANGAQATMRHSTLTENASDAGSGGKGGGGAIDVDPSAQGLVLSHTVFHRNTNEGKGQPGGDESDVWGSFTSQGNNFLSIGKPTGALSWAPQATDQFGTAAAPRDALLGPLQANGGRTLSQTPLLNSPLIDTGAVAANTVAVDVRGYPRLVGPRVDIGAVEVQFDAITGASRPSVVVTGGDRQVTAVNSNFEQLFEVTVRDPYGTLVPNRGVTFSGPGVTFPAGAAAVTGADGKATILAFASNLVGIHRVRAQLTGDVLSDEFRQVNKPGEGVVDPVGGNGQAAVVTTQYGQQLVAQAFTRDAAGKLTPLANADLYFAVVPAAAGGTFPDGSTLLKVQTDAEGVAATPFTANTKAGPVQVVAAVGRYGAAVFGLTNLPGAPTSLAFVSGTNQATPILTTFPQPLAVVTTDQFGNPVGGVPVSFAGQTNPDSPGVTFPAGAGAVSDAAGVAQVAVAANSKIGPHQVVATSPAVGGQVAFDLVNQQGAAATITLISGSGQAAPVTETFAAPLVVEVRDAGGNLISGIGVTFTAPPSGASAAFPAGATAVTGPDGRAVLAVGANTKAGSYAVVAGIAGATSATFELTNLPGAPALITVVAGDGQSTAAGTPFPAPVRVLTIDAFGNPVAGVVPTVTVVGSGGPGAAFTVAPSGPDGVATVTATANAIPGSYRASAAVGGLQVLFGLTNTVPPAGEAPAVPQTGLATQYAVGTGEGTTHRVWVYNDAGQRVSEFQPYDAGFAGGVRAVVLRTPTGIQVLTGPGAGRFADVRTFGADGKLVREHAPFEGSFTGGVFLAAADLNRDGWDDFAVSPDQGGGPRVQVVSGKDGAVLADFFGIADPNFRGGARVAFGDVNGDQVPDLMVAAGFGGGPRVAVFDGTTVGVFAEPRRLVDDFFVFEQTLRNGVYVASGDVDGDGKFDVVVGAGPGGGPRVVTLSGADMVAGTQRRIADFFAGSTDSRNGVRVTMKDLDTDALADLVVGEGAGDGSRVTVYPGRFLTGRGTTGDVTSFEQLPGQPLGVFVG